MVKLMNLMAYGLLTSATMAASVRRDKKHHAHHHKKAKIACSESTAPYPVANATTPIAISESASSTDVATHTTHSIVTVSVIPVPVPTTSDSVAASSAYSSLVGASSVAASAPAGSACGGVVTTYVTVQQTIYVTATQAPSSVVTSVAASSKTKKHKKPKKSKVPCSSSSATSVAVPSSSSVQAPSSSSVVVPPPSSSSAVIPAPSAPIATAPLPSTSGANNIQSSSPVATSSATSSAAAPPATSSVAPSTPVNSGPYTGPKMGVSWDPSQNYDLSSVGLTLPHSWAYDWGQAPHGVDSGIQYVASLHDSSKAPTFASDLAAIGATYAKNLNEPDMNGNGGSGVTPSAAVAMHNQYIAPLMDKYYIGLPAVTSNNIVGQSGTGWLTAFIQELGTCEGFKFADFHFYGGGEDAATQAKIFLGYVDNWISTVDSLCKGMDLPIWISEFSATPVGDNALATEFMGIVGPQLEANPRVARYAYWFPQNSEINGVISSVLNAVGL